MFEIEETVTSEYEIKGSRFICTLQRAEDIVSARKFINEIKEKYSDATHNCYAYVFSTSAGSSDDGEPSHTAGIPILNVLQKNKIVNVVCVVTRYFGGIKLGAGGLTRAYTNSVATTVKLAHLIPVIKTVNIKFKIEFSLLGKIENILNKYKQINKEFNEQVTLSYIVPESELKDVLSRLKDFQINKIDIV